MHFWTFRLQPPHAPLFRPCLLLRTGLTPASRGCAIGGSSDFALCSQSRQSHKAVSSSFRGFTINPSVLRTIHSLPVALHPVSPRRSYFPLLAFSSAREGLPPSYAHSISSARARSSRPHPSASRRRNLPAQLVHLLREFSLFKSSLNRKKRELHHGCHGWHG